jgi:23S rRNA (pseudouridine1915-N3)-methyltransferase
MAITIVTVGKTKQDFIISGFEEYQKRINRYTNLKIIDLPDSSLKNNDMDAVRETEADNIIKQFKENDYLIALDSRGKSFSSEQFAAFLENNLKVNLIFCIGGVYGLSQRVLNKANLVLSFSAFTFTHQMIRLLLIEQIYRAFNILNGGKYHK